MLAGGSLPRQLLRQEQASSWLLRWLCALTLLARQPGLEKRMFSLGLLLERDRRGQSCVHFTAAYEVSCRSCKSSPSCWLSLVPSASLWPPAPLVPRFGLVTCGSLEFPSHLFSGLFPSPLQLLLFAPHTLSPCCPGQHCSVLGSAPSLRHMGACVPPRLAAPSQGTPKIPAGSVFSSRFSNLGVLHVTKKNMMEIMKEKLKKQKMRNRSRLLTGEGSLGAQWDLVP